MLVKYTYACGLVGPPLATASRDTKQSPGDSPVTEQAKLEPQRAEEGEFTDLEGLDLTSKLDLLRKNEQWKCQVKKEALEVPTYGFCSWGVFALFSRSEQRDKREREREERGGINMKERKYLAISEIMPMATEGPEERRNF